MREFSISASVAAVAFALLGWPFGPLAPVAGHRLAYIVAFLELARLASADVALVASGFDQFAWHGMLRHSGCLEQQRI
jgi:hypothetical protein